MFKLLCKLEITAKWCKKIKVVQFSLHFCSKVISFLHTYCLSPAATLDKLPSLEHCGVPWEILLMDAEILPRETVSIEVISALIWAMPWWYEFPSFQLPWLFICPRIISTTLTCWLSVCTCLSQHDISGCCPGGGYLSVSKVPLTHPFCLPQSLNLTPIHSASLFFHL